MDAAGECRQPPVKEPCRPSPCGPNAECSVGPVNNPICVCRPGFYGDAQSSKGCGPECTTNSECPTTLACINQKCRDPCPGTCGQNAVCRVVEHNPVCACVEGFTGNAYQRCTPVPVVVEPVPTKRPPRPPTAPNVIGSRPECVLNSDCPSNLACVNQQCRDPCPGVCGPNAVCTVVDHNPICNCMRGYVGEPTRQCGIPVVPSPPREPVVSQPCTPSPCGPYGECRVVNSQAVCSCLPGYFGNPCRPECSVSSDCPPSLHCVNQKCRDPCPGVCGVGAVCVVRDHNPICSCPNGLTGDPFIRCLQPVAVQQEPSTARPLNPCNPPPCGPGAQCKQQGSNAVCSCPPNYLGDPYSACRPECVQNSECPRDKSCINNRCVNPCPGVCGLNAECRVINHSPVCSCIEGYAGDASSACRPIPVESRPIEPVVTDSCSPSPCGPNSICRNINGVPSCSCQPSYIGVPPDCRPECVSNSECPSNMACVAQRCRDPCPGVCGENAECRVVNHNPICNCARGFTGDPFIRCQPIPVIPQQPVVQEPVNPCIPTPCGPNSQCQVIGSQARCSCQPNMIGSPPDCRPECIVNSDCPSDRACVAQRCKNPCPGTCGENTECRVVANNPVCICQPGFGGDPFRGCVPVARKFQNLIYGILTEVNGFSPSQRLYLNLRHQRHHGTRAYLHRADPTPCAGNKADQPCVSVCRITSATLSKAANLNASSIPTALPPRPALTSAASILVQDCAVRSLSVAWSTTSLPVSASMDTRAIRSSPANPFQLVSAASSGRISSY